jgi:hypothetical protein
MHHDHAVGAKYYANETIEGIQLLIGRVVKRNLELPLRKSLDAFDICGDALNVP